MSSLRKLRIEALEVRQLLAGDAAAADVGGVQAAGAPSVDLTPPATSAAAPAVTYTFADNGALIANPDTGWQAFGSATNDTGFPTGTLYTRFDWRDIEPVVGQYNFTQIDQTLASLRGSQRLAFRIMTFDDDAGPTAYANAGLAGTWADYAGVTRFQPNLNNAAVQTAVTNLINALGQRYSDPTRIDSFEIGFFGPWGEWSETNSFVTPLPTLATCQWLISTSQAAFPNIPIVVNAFFDQMDGAMAAAAAAGVGWRGDSWGDHPRPGQTWTNQGDLYDPIIAAHPNGWKTAPIYMEPFNVISQWAQDGANWNTVAQWTIANHVSAIQDKLDGGNLTAAQKDQISALLLKIGYRPLISQLTVSGDTLTVTIRNNGNAPAYTDHYLRLLIDGVPLLTNVSLKGLLPGDSTFTITNSRLGTASSLALGFVNQNGASDIQLAQNGTVNNNLIVSLTPSQSVTASIAGPSTPLRNQLQTYTLSATNAPVNSADRFTFAINWGDGSPVQSVVGVSGAQVTHTFATGGVRTINVTATSQSGAVSPVAAKSINVATSQLLRNAQNATLFDLVWSGANGDDQVKFEQLSATSIRVSTILENGVARPFSEVYTGVTGLIRASGGSGDDSLDASPLTTTQVIFDGGAGNNSLLGGAADDFLIGGSNGAEGQQGGNTIIGGGGNDTIFGNAIVGAEGSTGGNNLIVGGSGNDTVYGNFLSAVKRNGQPSLGGVGGENLIVGGSGADLIYASQLADGAEGGKGSILVGGNTNLTITALEAVLDEWISTRAYAVKVANITGVGSGTRNNGVSFLQMGVTVFNDGAIDRLYSDTNGRTNWLFLTLGQDLASRVKNGEIVTTLT